MREQIDYWRAKVANLMAETETAGRRMAIERDNTIYEILKQEYSRLAVEAKKANLALAKATAALSVGDEISVLDEEVEAAVRIVRHLANTLKEPANREEASEIFRRLGIKIGLTFGEQKFGPKQMVRRLKGGVVVYGHAEFPEAARPTPASDVIGNTVTESQAAKALLAAVDPNARKEGRKSLDRRQAGTQRARPQAARPAEKPLGA